MGGDKFTQMAHAPRSRKAMVVRSYGFAVLMCYALSVLAAPKVRSLLSSTGLVTALQVTAAFAMGAGVAVQFYQIPAIVGATFGSNKGLYAAYTDGVSYSVGALVWRVVAGAVEEGDAQGGGWAYGWAAVALLVVLCGLLMVEFMEHYFVRGGWKGGSPRVGAGGMSGPDMASRKRGNGGRDVYRNNSGSDHLIDALSSSTSTLGETVRRRGQKLLMQPGSPLSFLGAIRKKPKSWLDEDEDDDEASTILFDSVTSPIDFSDLATPPACERRREPKTTDEMLKYRVLGLLERKDNQVCCDCTKRFPRWASIIVPPQSQNLPLTVGCFICHACAGSHRKLGTHVVFVRSVDHDRLKETEVCALEQGGNGRVKALYEATLGEDGGTKPTAASDGRTREEFAVAKYNERRWFYSTSTAFMAVNGVKVPGTAVLADLSSEEEAESDDDNTNEAARMSAIELTNSPMIPKRTRPTLQSAAASAGTWSACPIVTDRETLSEPGSSSKDSASIPSSSTFNYSFSPPSLSVSAGKCRPNEVDLLNLGSTSLPQSPLASNGGRQHVSSSLSLVDQQNFDSSDTFQL